MPFDDPPLPIAILGGGGVGGGGGGIPPGGDETAPANPTGLVATPGNTTALLGWSDNTEVDFNHYNVYRGTVSGGPYTLIASLGASEYTATGLSNGTTYYFVITAVDNFGNESLETGEVSVTPAAPPGGDVTPPAVPTGLTATPGDRQIVLNWNNVADSDFASYKVYRSLTSGGSYTLIATRTVSDYIDTGLTNSTTYFYKVSAVDTSGNESAQSSAVSAVPVGVVGDTTPPPTPTGLTATAADRAVVLDWNDSGAGDFSHYRIYRSLSATGTFSFIATRTLSNHTDGNLTNGTTYWYKVTAVDTSNNESAQTASVNATPEGIVIPPPVGGDGFPVYADRAVTINVGDDWDTVINSVSAGTIIGVAPGVHLIDTAGKQFSPRNGEILVGQIDGSGVPTSIIRGNWDQTQSGGGLVSPFPFVNTGAYTSNVQFLRLMVERFAPGFQQAAINGGDNWRIHKCHIHSNLSVGVRLGDGAILFGSKIYHNGQMGLKSKTASTGATVDSCEVYDNNYALWNGVLGEAGGQKFIGLDPVNMVVRRSHYHDNKGAGIWYDDAGAGGIIEDNLVHDNVDAGIHYEISSGQAIIRRNTAFNNGGPGNIYISNSRGTAGTPIIVEDNLVYNALGHAEIWMKDNPARSPRLGYVTIRRNRVHRAINTKLNISCGEFGSTDLPPGITINENRYFTNVSNSWQWRDVRITWSQWRALGFDTLGSLSQYQAP